MGTTRSATITPFSILDGDIARNAALSEVTMHHAYHAFSRGGVAIGGTPVNYESIEYVATGPGTVSLFRAALNVAGSASSMTADLLKNGVSILSSAVTITNATGNRTTVEGSIASPSFVAGDVFSIKFVVSSSTGASGPYAAAAFIETAAPS